MRQGHVPSGLSHTKGIGAMIANSGPLTRAAHVQTNKAWKEHLSENESAWVSIASRNNHILTFHAPFVPKLGIKFVTKVTNPHTSAPEAEQRLRSFRSAAISTELSAMVRGTCIHQSASITNTCKGSNSEHTSDDRWWLQNTTNSEAPCGPKMFELRQGAAITKLETLLHIKYLCTSMAKQRKTFLKKSCPLFIPF